METCEALSIITWTSTAYVKVKLLEVMHVNGITGNKLSTLTGIKYDVIDRYYKAASI